MKIAVNTSISTGDLSFSELEELGELVYFRDAPTEELKVLAADCDAIMINKEEITEELLAACPKVKYIGVFGDCDQRARLFHKFGGAARVRASPCAVR